MSEDNSNEVNEYSDVLKKFQNLHDKSENEEYRKNVLIDGTKYLSELIIIMEENKDNTMSQDIAISIENGFNLFLKSLGNIDMIQLFKDDSNYANEIFYSFINLFNLSPFKNYLKRLKVNNFLQILYGNFIMISLQFSAVALSACKLTIDDLKEPLDNQESLILMLNFMKNEFESDSSLTYSKTTESILTFLWNYADKTVIIPNLIKVGYPEVILRWFSIIDKSDDVPLTINLNDLSLLLKLEKPKSNAVRPLISIIHNISRHDDGINILNSLNAIDIIKKVQSWTNNSEINFLCCMILALLSTPEQIKNDRKRMNNALDQLLQTVSNASKSDDYKDDGFHISEPLVVLVKLFNDDRALDYILQHAQVQLDDLSTLLFFINLLIKFYNNVNSEKDLLKQLTCTALVNIIWSISFQEHHQYKRQLKNHENLNKLLQIFSDIDQINENITNKTQYVPKFIENIQTAAKGILLNITETISLQKRQSTVELLVPQTINKAKIMISYSHDDKILCYQLENELKRREEYDIWIDKEFCTTGDSWEHIARGIKQSDVVLCLITKNYTSKSVRREVIYAIDRLDKPLLPVFISKPNLPEWLDIRTCDLTHVRFTDEKQLDQTKISKLIETLQKLISGSHTGGGTSPPTHFEPVTPVTNIIKEDKDKSISNKTKNNLKKSIDQWDKCDIEEWFKENGIITELYDLCKFNDGLELLNYAKILLQDEKSQYKIYSDEFPRLYNGKILLLHQFNKFSNALRKLNNKQEQQSKICLIL